MQLTAGSRPGMCAEKINSEDVKQAIVTVFANSVYQNIICLTQAPAPKIRPASNGIAINFLLQPPRRPLIPR
jgi:hypothetical protein